MSMVGQPGGAIAGLCALQNGGNRTYPQAAVNLLTISVKALQTLRGHCYCYPHCRHQETEAKTGPTTCLGLVLESGIKPRHSWLWSPSSAPQLSCSITHLPLALYHGAHSLLGCHQGLLFQFLILALLWAHC